MKPENKSAERIRVFLVDDHPATLTGVRALLDEADIEVIGEARTGKEAVREILACEPQVVILDVRLPDMDGRQVLKRVKAGYPEAAVILFTAFEEPAYLLDALDGGAEGFLLKTAPPDEVISVVRRVAAGDNCLTRAYWEPLYRRLQERSVSESKPAPGGWTDREVQLLREMGKGLSNQEIAKNLGLNPDTIKFHAKKIFKRLRAGGRAQAVGMAVGLGIIPPPEPKPLQPETEVD